MNPLILATPLFLLFELWQLVMSERYVGIKQIARNGDPRKLGLAEITAFFWSTAIILYWLWMLALLSSPFSRVHGLILLIVSIAGYSVRRNCGLKWVLVTLTLEGAIRIGLLVSLAGMAWRRL
ncbi:MAG: hypothetical protein JWM88_1309 [Verrucomicrobia bacterium]|nr:hypothetical protein [Verrucomicrobiota bacterium]